MIARRIVTLGLTAILAGALPAGASQPADASRLADPGRPVLTVVPPDGPPVKLTMAELEGLGLASLSTTTPWTDGQHVFEGVPLARIIERFAPSAQTVELCALNDYRVEVPASDAQDYQVLLATRNNGARMAVRDKGPLWLVYPLDRHPELDQSEYMRRMIWQVAEIILR